MGPALAFGQMRMASRAEALGCAIGEGGASSWEVRLEMFWGVCRIVVHAEETEAWRRGAGDPNGFRGWLIYFLLVME